MGAMSSALSSVMTDALTSSMGVGESDTPALPLQLGAFAWYDASDTSPTNIVHDANAVSQFSDKSGNALHLTSTGAQRSTTNTRTLNGKNVLDLSTDDRLDAPAGLNAIANSNHTVLMVVQQDTLTGSVAFMQKAGGSGQFQIQNNTSNVLSTAASSGFNFATVPFTLGTTQHVLGSMRSGANVFAMFDNVQSAANTSGSDVTGLTNIYFGSNSFAAAPLDGAIAEIVIFNKALSASERIQMRDYFAAKWGTPAFMPTDVAAASLWLDASDTATITHTTNAVSSWFDRSGLVNHSTQGTGAAQPTTNTRTENSRNVLDFDGTDDFMVLPSGLYNFHNATTGTYFIVVGADAPSLIADKAVFGGANSANQYVQFLTKPSASGVRFRLSNGTTEIASVFSLGNGLNIWIMRKDAGTMRPYINGTVLNTAASGQAVLNNLEIGRFVNSPSAVWNGTFAEILMYQPTLTLSETNEVVDYLADKWGVTTTPL